jgi:acetyltransferase-like isoleucine patch superfamily enzyme
VSSGEPREASKRLSNTRGRAFDAYVVMVNALLRVPVHRFREWVFRRIARNALGHGSVLERGVRITTKGGVSVGGRTIIGRGVTLDGRGPLEIGELVNISPEAALLTADHDPDSPTFKGRNQTTVVGDRVWIATRAMILPGATLGDGALVAAGSVVHGSVAPWTIVSGNPVSAIGQRSPEAQADLPLFYRRLFY